MGQFQSFQMFQSFKPLKPERLFFSAPFSNWPEVWKHKPEEFTDSSFVEELDKSGFIKKLYEK